MVNIANDENIIIIFLLSIFFKEINLLKGSFSNINNANKAPIYTLVPDFKVDRENNNIIY